MLGTGDRLGVTAAAFANGAFSQALEFDDTHNESIVHMSSPAVAAALALSEYLRPVSGRDLITAIALGNEISCRVGSVASGQFHKRGFHPTGLFATFGTAYLASKLLGLNARGDGAGGGHLRKLRVGIVAMLGRWNADEVPASWLGCAERNHGRDSRAYRNNGSCGSVRRALRSLRIASAGCGAGRAITGASAMASARTGRAATLRSSLFPRRTFCIRTSARFCACVRSMASGPSDVERIECPVTAFIVGIVCEPVEEKFAPASDSHGRVSLQYSLAEALALGSLGKNAYAQESLRDRAILALARRVHFYVDPDYPGPRPLQR